ncbi:MAG: cadmium-translocating P-type ATPase [Deltaproteobacteria bacterium]|nr:cadmium-translocating P-type ATPase [Deltaproteobacteria bacterium]
MPAGADCDRCLSRLREALLGLRGIEAVQVSPGATRLTVQYDPLLVPLELIERKVHEVGAELARSLRHATLPLGGLDCPDCAVKVERALSRLPGVLWVAVSFAASSMVVEYDAEQVGPQAIEATVRRLGYEVRPAPAPGGVKAATFFLRGVDCGACAGEIEARVRALPGVRQASVDVPAASLRVAFEDGRLSEGRIIHMVGELGFRAVPQEASEAPGLRFWLRDRRAATTAAAGLLVGLGLAGTALGAPRPAGIVLYALAMLLGGAPVARSGLLALRARTVDMNLLMTVAALGAVAIGEWLEGAMVVFLFALGNTLQRYTLERTRRAIRTLISHCPAEALVRRDGHERRLPVEAVEVGDLLLVRPGERIPLDGVVQAGASTVNQAPITGESVPVEKGPGEVVFAGTLNGAGLLEVRVTRPFSESTLARIIHLVEEAQAQRAPSQQFVDRFARYYTPLVLAAAVLGAALPPLAGWPFEPWFYRSLALLLVACPCALVISTPVAIVSAIGAASRAGVLIKGGIYLERAGAIRAVAFDKTGTLTVGRPQVTDVVSLDGVPADRVLQIAAGLERGSEHPVATAILAEARRRRLEVPEVAGFQATAGGGVEGDLDGEHFLVGSPRFLETRGLPTEAVPALETLAREGRTAVLVGTPQRILGLVAVADTPRHRAREAIARLRALGIAEVVMLTGDQPGVAQRIAEELGVDTWQAGLLPEEKVAAVRSLKARGAVAMVGDGINDAPALAAASLGVAMGAAGTDVALESADVALMSDDLLQLPFLIALGQQTLRTIRANIVFALVAKAVVLALIVPGWLTLWLAVAGDMGTSLLVTLYGMRLLRAA